MTGFAALPLAHEEGEGDHQQHFKGVSRILGPRWARLPTLTAGLLGVQIFWSVEMSYASPYLLSLGLTKSNMAIVFVAGPLSGLIMQPLIGVLADSSTSRFGRRRPYMLLGTFICMIAMLLLGFTRPVASVFTALGTRGNDVLTIWLAVLAIYLIDFSINAVQAVDRALLVDTIPSSEQAAGNAWAARMLGVGSVVGFFVGNVNLTQAFPFLGKTQLQVLSVIVSLLLLAGHLLMAILVKERVLLKPATIDGKKPRRKGFIQELKDIWSNMLTLPRVIRQICIIQFFAWIAWFPILFYTTIYVGDLYKRVSPIPTTSEAQALLDAEATRLGSRALFFSSVLSLVANVTLPAFATEAAGRRHRPGTAPGIRVEDEAWWDRLCRVPSSLQVHLATMWAVSHLVFAGCMFATFFTHSVLGATILITITGFSWAITQWAPFSLLAEAILTEPMPSNPDDAVSIRLTDTRTRRHSAEPAEHDIFLPGDDSDDEDAEELRRMKKEHTAVMSNSGAQLSRIDVSGRTGGGVVGDDEDDDYEMVPDGSGADEGIRRSNHHDNDVDEGGDGGNMTGETGSGGGLSAKAGIILGIHNVFIVIPQFLVTGLSAIVFAIFDPQKSVLPGHHSSGATPVPVNATAAMDSLLALKNASSVYTDTILERRHLLFQQGAGLFLRDTSEEFQGRADYGQSDSVVYIFRFGGFAATLAFVLCWRLARELRHR